MRNHGSALPAQHVADMDDTKFEILPDLPESGPLSMARKQASFNWKDMRILMEDEALLRYKVMHFYLFF